MIEITKESQDMIEKWFILSYPFGASNMKFKYHILSPYPDY